MRLRVREVTADSLEVEVVEVVVLAMLAAVAVVDDLGAGATIVASSAVTNIIPPRHADLSVFGASIDITRRMCASSNEMPMHRSQVSYRARILPWWHSDSSNGCIIFSGRGFALFFYSGADKRAWA